MKHVITTKEEGTLFISASEIRLALVAMNPKLKGILPETGTLAVSTSVGIAEVDGVSLQTRGSTNSREVEV